MPKKKKKKYSASSEQIKEKMKEADTFGNPLSLYIFILPVFLFTAVFETDQGSSYEVNHLDDS